MKPSSLVSLISVFIFAAAPVYAAGGAPAKNASVRANGTYYLGARRPIFVPNKKSSTKALGAAKSAKTAPISVSKALVKKAPSKGMTSKLQSGVANTSGAIALVASGAYMFFADALYGPVGSPERAYATVATVAIAVLMTAISVLTAAEPGDAAEPDGPNNP